MQYNNICYVLTYQFYDSASSLFVLQRRSGRELLKRSHETMGDTNVLPRKLFNDSFFDI